MFKKSRSKTLSVHIAVQLVPMGSNILDNNKPTAHGFTHMPTLGKGFPILAQVWVAGGTMVGHGDSEHHRKYVQETLQCLSHLKIVKEATDHNYKW